MYQTFKKYFIQYQNATGVSVHLPTTSSIFSLLPTSQTNYLNNDLKMPTLNQLTTLYYFIIKLYTNFNYHSNPLFNLKQLSSITLPVNVQRRLKIQWPRPYY